LYACPASVDSKFARLMRIATRHQEKSMSTALALNSLSLPTSFAPQFPKVAFSLPSTLGSIDTYISAVNRYPLLTQEEETQYGRALRDHGDTAAAGKLVMSHLRLVVAIARGYLGYGLPHADLIQEGNIGLMKAVKRFDPERGVRLVSFALHWIKAEIHEYVLRNWRLVKVATTKAQRKLFFNLRSHKQGTEAFTQKEIHDIATELNVKPSDVLEMEKRLGNGTEIAMESESDDDNDFAPIAYLSREDDDPARTIEAEQIEVGRSTAMETALAKLDARSRRIIETRWLRDEKDQLTLHDLAAEYNVSAERIRQLEVKAMKLMKNEMAAYA
jgi:RNA polymerase sigma-32 factor